MPVIEIISIIWLFSIAAAAAIYLLQNKIVRRRDKIDKQIVDQAFFNLKISALIIDYNCNQILILSNLPNQRELESVIKARNIILTDFLKLMKPM
jgi:hypothetical protein